MDKKGLLIGIDFTEKYCKVCYFNERHARVENVLESEGDLGIQIPSVLCFDKESNDWIIGEKARRYSLNTGAFLYTDLLTNTLAEGKYEINGQMVSFSTLFAVFIEKLLELVRKNSGVFPIAFVNIAMRRVNLEIKAVMENVFNEVGIEKEKIHLLNYPESFAYFILQQDEALWKDGALLFDFSQDGFFYNRLSLAKERGKNLIYVNEKNYSMEFSFKDLDNIVLRPRMDEKFGDLYEEVKGDEQNASVYFTGPGFEELWFSKTLSSISASRRAFRGNNIYAKGACLEGLIRKEGNLDKFTVICRPKTRAYISVEARYKNEARTIILSPAAVNWYEASGEIDFILDEKKSIDFKITSLLSREETYVNFNLQSFPMRPPKTTRARVSVKYINEYECEICITDLGFGQFFEASQRSVRKILNLEGYI